MSPTPAPAAGTTWTVTGQPQATVKQDASGKAVRGYVVNFTLGTGQTGDVFVAENQFTPDMVKQLVADAAANLAAIVNLTSS